MSDEFVLDAELRSDKGKGASRRLRRTGKVPAIVYGGTGETQSITLDHSQVSHRLENEAFYSHILTLKIDGKPQEAILRDMQRHPIKPIILHMDFNRISQDRAIHVHVPLHFLNEEKCIGVKQEGGVISKMLNELEVSCLPKDLPEFINIDMLELKLGSTVHLSDIQMPEGVHIASLVSGGDDVIVASVHKHKEVVEEVPEGEEVVAGAVPTAAEAEETKQEDGDS
ncbi:MAG: 50S ribosomal protein L25/general stress protein Ctc [Gammaproteobacteria bacterium]|nr:50S ribosomal protein L25/general stress protein Ctc [Gammaproteobacteria bacterium]